MPLKGFYATTSGFPKYFSSMAGQIQGRKDHQEGGMAVLRLAWHTVLLPFMPPLVAFVKVDGKRPAREA